MQLEPSEEITIHLDTPMTLQLGLVGTDGIVIASDKKVSEYGPRTRQESTTDKFVYTDNLLCAYAGTSSAGTVALNLMKQAALPPAGEHEWRLHLQQHFDKVPASAGAKQLDELLVVRRDDLSRFWWVSRNTSHNQTQAEPIMDQRTTGDAQSLSKFLLWHFYRKLPLAQLARLAALIIFYGTKENSGVGNGFDLIQCTDNCISPLSPEKKAELLQQCEEFHRHFGTAVEKWLEK